MGFKKVAPAEISGNVFQMIGKQWMLVTAGSSDAGLNSMTASWGGMGVIWNKPTALCVVRPQRHTFGFMEREEYYTLSFYPEEHRAALNLFGSKSGRDMDKVAAAGFTTAFAECGAPYFEEADLVIVCRKVYVSDLEEGKFLDGSIVDKQYPERDFHRAYVGEIIEVLEKTE